MLWNTLIKQITFWVGLHPEHPGAAVILQQAQAAGVQFDVYLKDLDIRKVGVLRELVPEAFPKPLRNRDRLFVLKENIHGKWRVDLQEPPNG